MNLEPGIALKKYKWGALLGALPISLFLLVYFKVMQRLVRRPLARIPLETLPDNVFIYAFHDNFYFYHTSRGGQAEGDVRAVWLGYHGFASYFPTLIMVANQIHLLRFDFGVSQKPFAQILEFLLANPHVRFGVLTDAGGPYYRVRHSVYDLSQASHRPVAAMTFRCSRFWKLGIHRIPRPLSRIEVKFSRVFTAEELAKLGREKGTALLQTALEEIHQL